MKKIMDGLIALLKQIMRFFLARKNVAVRSLFTFFFALVLIIPIFAILVLTAVQFLLLFVTVKHADAIKSLSHILTLYVYKILRYMSLNENQAPFPFNPMPGELEPPAETDLTNPLPPVTDPMSPDENLEATEADSAETGPDSEENTSSEPIILDYNEDRKQS
jgi:hypothetical protein